MAAEKKMRLQKGELHPIISHHLALLLLLLSCPWIPLSQSLTIKTLPGFPGPLPFHMESGYVGVGEMEQDQLFYYFIESETNPREDPLMVWLTGGPGCSAWSGLVYEIGPLRFEPQEYDGSLPTLSINEYSWTKASSIIFLDSPVWTGFSYSKGPKDAVSGDFKSCREVHQFLRKWLNDHPQFRTNPIYIGGDSYSGLTVPIIAQEISNANEAGQEPILNLKGYLVGNPGTDPKFDGNSRVPFLHGMGMISDELYESAKTNCRGDYTIPSNEECAKVLQEINLCTFGINYVHILEPTCFLALSKPKDVDENRRSLKKSRELISQPPSPQECRSYAYLHSYTWANDDNVRSALGIHKGSIKEWVRCNYGLHYTKDVTSALPYHLNVTTKGYRALVYSGDHDLSIPFVGTQAWVKSLNFSVVDKWRSWFVDFQIGGYTVTYANNMTFATIKGGGHTAPEYKPKESLAMFQRFISEKPL